MKRPCCSRSTENQTARIRLIIQVFFDEKQGFGVLNLLHACFHGFGLSPSAAGAAVVNNSD